MYKEDLTRSNERTSQGRPRPSNVAPIAEIGGDIDGGTIVNEVSIITKTENIKMAIVSPLVSRATMISKTIYLTTRVTTPTTNT